jgi:AcrR family transcriptional regulator
MEAKASASRRELTKAQNRETILAAARLVFAEMGFAAATVRDIIRATPLASGTFYNYFKSKEEVYQALRDEQALRLRPRLREARLAATDAREFFQASFEAFFAFVAENSEGRSPAAPDPFRMDSPEVLAGFAELKEDIAAAMARGLIPAADTGSLAAAVAGVAFELGGRVKAGADVAETARFATALFVGGVASLPAA